MALNDVKKKDNEIFEQNVIVAWFRDLISR